MKDPATLKQRTALYNMYTALNKPFAEKAKIRNMGFGEAHEAIEKTLKEIQANGFPRKDFYDE